MKLKDFKEIIKNQEYNIPDVLNKIKDNLPEVKVKYIPKKQVPRYKFRYAVGFMSLFIVLLFAFSSITLNPTFSESSGPMELNYFSSTAEIESTVKRFNKQKDSYINKSNQVYENYTLSDIKINKTYNSNNQTALTYGNLIYYLDDDGIVVYDVSTNNILPLHKEALNYDAKTNVKTMYLVNKNLVVVYNNSNYVNVVKFNVDTMYKIYEYSIASTYVNSYVYNNNLYLVTILNNTILPNIRVNSSRIVKSPTDIGYLENIVGSSYTILKSINLSTNATKDTIFLSFDKWDIAYFNNNNLYLINNHMNYKKNLDYGEYTTVVKFRNIEDQGFVYHGSYSIKGSVQDETNVYEYNNEFRMALETTNYNVKRVFLFFKKVVEVEQYVNVVNLVENVIDENHGLELASSFRIDANNEVDAAISIISSTFNRNEVVLESRSGDTLVNVLSFEDSDNIIQTDFMTNQSINLEVRPIDSTFGINFRTIKTSTGEFEMRFFDLRGYSPVEIEHEYAYLNYSYLLDDSDFIVIEAIKYSNSIYIDEDINFYYLGFSVTNNKETNGTYTLIVIDKVTKNRRFLDLGHEDVIINKVVSIEPGVIYGLTNENIMRFKLEGFHFPVKEQSLNMK